jgi:hypothetical protein
MIIAGHSLFHTNGKRLSEYKVVDLRFTGNEEAQVSFQQYEGKDEVDSLNVIRLQEVESPLSLQLSR